MADWFVRKSRAGFTPGSTLEPIPTQDGLSIALTTEDGLPGSVALVQRPDGTGGVAATSVHAVAASDLLRLLIDGNTSAAMHLPAGFAACIWRGRRLELVRSNWGEVPLEVQLTDGALCASTDPSRLSATGFSDGRLVDYLHGAPFHGRSGLRSGVERVEPGERRVYDGLSETRSEQLWRPDDSPTSATIGIRDIRNALRQRVENTPDCVDVATLSGGLDSAGVVAAWCHVHDVRPSDPLPCVSLVAPGLPSLDERPRIEALQRLLPIDVDWLDGRSLWALHRGVLTRVPPRWGPTASSTTDTLLATYHRAARHGQTVLTGQGGDLLMAWSDALQIRSSLHNPAELTSLVELARLMPPSAFLKQLAIELLRKTPPLFEIVRRFKRHRQKHPWILAPPAALPEVEHSLAAMKWRQLRSWDWELGLRNIRYAARATGTETVDPLFDNDLFNAVAGLEPAAFRGPHGRRVWREALAAWLPDEHIQAPKAGLMDSLVEKGLAIVHRAQICSLFNPGVLDECGFIDHQRFLKAYDHYCSQVRAAFPRHAVHGSWPIWRTISAELWLRALRSDTVPPHSPSV